MTPLPGNAIASPSPQAMGAHAPVQGFRAQAPAAMETPDILFVLRRYVRWIVFGTLLGTILAAAAYLYFRRVNPKYTATVVFQVLAPSQGLGEQQQSAQPQTNADEVTTFIHRQMLYITSDEVLNAAIQQEAFHTDPNTNQPTRWYTDNAANPKKALQRDLVVEPVVLAGVFKIELTTNSSNEAANLVNTVSHVYIDTLRSDNKVNQSEQLNQMYAVLQTQQQAVKEKQDSLAEFRKDYNISAVVNLHSLQLELLKEMDSRTTQEQAAAAAASASLENINKQLKAGTLALSVDMDQYVETHPQLQSLEQLKLSLDQDRQVAAATGGSDRTTILAIDTRINKITQQIADTRSRLQDEARLRMQSRAQTEADSLNAEAQYLGKARDEKLNQVKDLDHYLALDKQREDDLKTQQDILQKLQQQYTFEKLKTSTDDLRIRRLGGDAVPPDEPSWPIWYKIVPVGFIAGLGLSFGLAYLFELTNTRVRTPRDITRTMQLPLLGFIPDQEDDNALTGSLGTSIRTSPTSMIAESFRQIRGRLAAQSNGHPIRTLLIASVAPGDGATTVASNLANGIALNNTRVLLIDANFYRPGLATDYKFLPSIGLSDVITDASKLDSALGKTDLPTLTVMGPGSRSASVNGDVLETAAFQGLLTTLKSRFDIVIFDGAPLSLVSDSLSLASRMDGVIAVVRAGQVSRGTVGRVREQLRQAHANLLGIVLNAAQTHGAGYFKKNYRSFYEYASGPRAAVNGSAN